MKVVGVLTREHLAKLKSSGLDPKACVDATIEAARERHPGATVIIQRGATHDGFDVVIL